MPAKERAEELGHYPAADSATGSGMPANLVYQLALARAEAGQFEQALALVPGAVLSQRRGRNLGGPGKSEIKLMQAEADATERTLRRGAGISRPRIIAGWW